MAFLLYTRRGCHLCEQAEDMLAVHVAAGSVQLVDVDAQPDLQRRFGTRVPVLAADGAVLMEGRFDEAELVRLVQCLQPSGRVTGPVSGPSDRGSR